MFLKNLTLTMIDMPDNTKMMPGEIKEVTTEEVDALKKHPCTGMWLKASAGVLSLSDEDGRMVVVPPTPEEETAEKRREKMKASKLAAIAAADSVQKLADMATNEKDSEILEALNKRAQGLVGAS